MMGGLLPLGGIVAGIITLAVGIVILVWPRIIAYIIGIYLIVMGLAAILASWR